MKSQFCPICSGNLRPNVLVARDPHSGQTFQIDRCSTCQAGFTRPIPTQLDLYYRDYHGARHGFTAEFCEWRRRRVVEKYHDGSSRVRINPQEFINTRPTGSALLDVGCGDAGFVRMMTARGWSAEGVDKYTEPNGCQDTSDGPEIPIVFTHRSIDEIQQGKQFDVITAWHVLEHVDDLHGMVKEISERLHDDGVFIVAVPNARSLGAKVFRGNWLHLDVPRHLTHFSYVSLRRLMAEHGLVVSRHYGSEWEYDVIGWIQSFLNSAGAPQNGLLDRLMGKPRIFDRRVRNSIFRDIVSRIISISRLLLALGLGASALPGILLMGYLGRGGTLLIVARHDPDHRNITTASHQFTRVDTEQ